MDFQQFLTIAAIIVICCTGYILGCIAITVNLDRILFLCLKIAVIIIMIIGINLCIQSRSLELRSECSFHKVSLFFPTHVHRSRIAMIQWFILRSHSININTFGLKCLYPFYEIGSIVLIISRIQLSACPRRQRGKIFQTLYLHPQRASPGGCNNLNRRINGQNLFQNRQDIVFLFTLQSKVLYSFRIATSIFAQRKVRTTNRNTNITKPETTIIRECFGQEIMAVRRLHL